MRTLFVTLSITISLSVTAQQGEISISRVDPPNWWIGMKNTRLQLLVYGNRAGAMTYAIKYPGVTLSKVTPASNPNYVFLDVEISRSARPGAFDIVATSGAKTIRHKYELLARSPVPAGAGVNASDFIYLIMPDRFANGDPSNDRFADMLDPSADRSSPYLRHGGDFKGIEDHLDYLRQLGVTSIWLTPIIDNDEKLKQEGSGRMQAGYHGYHFTDHYKVDKRFGGHEGYLHFSASLHKAGFKLIQDAVYNHVSDDHWMFRDQPMTDWFNVWPTYTNSSHKEQPIYDPHGSSLDKKIMLDGWFTPFLPDLNQRNPFLANYLIEHAIWSTEMYHVDAWRIDTYKYNDQDFMNRCNQALLDEYPNIHLFGESTGSTPLGVSCFVKNNVKFPFQCNLPGTLDFPLNGAINDALTKAFGWDDGVSRLHQTLAQDIVYADPMKLVTQLDNHDANRYFSVIGEDISRYKMGVIWLMTLRGIPSWYYGTEILMKNFKDPTDAEVRRDFPGGFSGDAGNKFTSEGRTAAENDAFAFVSKLAAYRKQTPALHSGRMMQFVPQDGVYVYFRYDDSKTIMIATNSTNHEVQLDTARYKERTQGFNSVTDVITGAKASLATGLQIPSMTAVIWELSK